MTIDPLFKRGAVFLALSVALPVAGLAMIEPQAEASGRPLALSTGAVSTDGFAGTGASCRAGPHKAYDAYGLVYVRRDDRCG